MLEEVGRNIDGSSQDKHGEHVDLEVHSSIGRLQILYDRLHSLGVIEECRLSPNTAQGAALELDLREPLAMDSLMDLLPGASRMEKDTSYSANPDIPTVHVFLGDNLPPKGPKPDNGLIIEVALAA